MSGITINSHLLDGGWLALEVEGEVDLATVSELEAAIAEAFSAGDRHLAVDLRGSSFMDSTGLKALVMANRKYGEAGREFAIAVSGGPVSRLIDLSGVNTSIRTVSALDELTDDS
jgi:anti-anti-sigma factor